MSTYYLYHRVPDEMSGTHIVPLSELKSVSPHLYERQKNKYVGREHIMNDIVHPLNCLWNDVVFLSAVHPKEVVESLEKTGPHVTRRTFFQIDASTLDPACTTVWVHKGNAKTPDTFLPFVPEELHRYSHLPIRTLAYYEHEHAHGRKPLIFAFVPHILFKGRINVSKTERITI